jgi:hypothetical protein
MIPVGHRHSHPRRIGSKVNAQESFVVAALQYFRLLGTGDFQVHFPGQSRQRRNERVRDVFLAETVFRQQILYRGNPTRLSQGDDYGNRQKRQYDRRNQRQ